MSEVGIRLGGPDRVSMRLLEEWPNGLCLSPLIKHPSQNLTDFLIKQYFENGAALFGRESSYEIELVRETVGGAFAGLDVPEITRIVQYYVQRTRNYAHIETLTQGMICKARIVGSGDGCVGRDGQIVSIVDAMSWVKWFKTLSYEEYGYRVYGKDQIFPPFDLECTCRLEGVIPGVD